MERTTRIDSNETELSELVEAAGITSPNYRTQKAVYLPLELYNQVEAVAARLGIPIKNLVREVIKRELPRIRISE